jgi:hypothetical protein
MVYCQQKATLYLNNRNITEFTRPENNTKKGKKYLMISSHLTNDYTPHTPSPSHPMKLSLGLETLMIILIRSKNNRRATEVNYKMELWLILIQ